MVQFIALLFFPLLMLAAASSDLVTMRISNVLVLILAVGFIVLALTLNMPLQQFGLHLACCVVVLVVAFTFFALGWVGGGDAKLAAATALWLGFGATLTYVLWAALLGGVLTLVLLGLRRLKLPGSWTKVTWIGRLHSTKTGIPYGIALAGAGMLSYSNTVIFQTLTA